MNLYKNFFSVGAMTLLSRVLGFARDIMIAWVLGTGMAANAYFAAVRFPNLFRRLFAEGAFNIAFIPLFAGVLEQEGEQAARAYAAKIISWLVALLIITTVFAEIFMPQIMALFVPGFMTDPAKFEFTILLARVCFPYLALMSVMAAFGGMLNGMGKFLAAAFAPVMLNIVMIIALGFLVVFAFEQRDAALILGVGVIIGGIAQVGVVVWALSKMGLIPHPQRPTWDQDIKRFFKLALPVILAGGVTQINIFVGTIIASGASSAISYLYYADRLYQLPLGIIGIAIGVVLLPELSRHLKANRHGEAELAQEKSLLMAMLLGVPAAVALFVLAQPTVSVLFERGAFQSAASDATASALAAFACGLPAFVLIKVFQPGFFARHDTMVPTVLASVSVAINIALSLFLFPEFSHTGIAIATSVSAWFNALFLAGILMKRGHFSMIAKQWIAHGLILLASGGMGFLLWQGADLFKQALADKLSPIVQFGALGLLMGVGFIAYFLLLHLFKVIRLQDFVRQISGAK